MSVRIFVTMDSPTPSKVVVMMFMTHSAPVVKIMKVSLSRSLIRFGVTCRRNTSRRFGTKSTPSISTYV
jgi:hypothetical protein